MRKKAWNHPGRSRYWGIFLFLLFITGSVVHIYFLEKSEKSAELLFRNCATIVALMPSMAAFIYLVLVPRRVYECQAKTLQAYQQLQRDIASSLHEGKTFDLPWPEQKDANKLDLLRRRPGQYLFSVLLLALPFLLVAVLSDSVIGVRDVTWYDNKRHLRGAIEGLVFAGYGVFVYTLVVMIHRMHASALSSVFLITKALRAVIMMTIGFAVGVTGIFMSGANAATQSTGEPGLFAYFIVGAFPSWAYEWIRKKARAGLKPDIYADNLSLEYVDGMDEVVIERLEELGISNVQHLATAEPVNLTLRTEYPFYRIIDWIDQAILITYLRKNSLAARELGIRGAIDMTGVYRQALQSPPPPTFQPVTGPAPAQTALLDPGERARNMLQNLANQRKLELSTLYNIGANLTNDFHVIMLSYLWHHRGVVENSQRKRMIDAISAALDDCQIQIEGGWQPGVIPHGECDALQSDCFKSQFSKHLNQRLKKLVMRWDGSIEDLSTKAQYDDLYEALLQNIHIQERRFRPKPESQKTPTGEPH
jgi:hypothetical protein